MQSDVQSDSKLVISICKKRSWSYNRHFYESTSSVLSRGQKVNWKVLLGKEHGKKPSHHSINPWSDCIFSVVYSSSLHFKNMTAYITRTKIDWGGAGLQPWKEKTTVYKIWYMSIKSNCTEKAEKCNKVRSDWFTANTGRCIFVQCCGFQKLILVQEVTGQIPQKIFLKKSVILNTRILSSPCVKLLKEGKHDRKQNVSALF